jgi:hypothetical protein
MKIDIRRIINEEILKLSVEEPWAGKVTEYMIDPTEFSQEYKTQQAIESFQKLYRSIDTDTKYFFIRWLRRAIMKQISSEEANEITRNVIASSKGYQAPEDKNS